MFGAYPRDLWLTWFEFAWIYWFGTGALEGTFTAYLFLFLGDILLAMLPILLVMVDLIEGLFDF